MAKVKLKFCRENLPILVAIKDYDTIIEAMRPLIHRNADSFINTKTPSFVLERDDYIQSACEAIIEAVVACDIKPKDGLYDYEEYWAKFINLCGIKLRSKLIELQKKFYLPVHVSQKVARLHPKIHVLSETEELTVEVVMKKFDVSESIAKELIDVTKAQFDTLVVVDSDDTESSVDVPVQTNVVSDIFVEEMLSLVDPLERQVIEAVHINDMSVKDFTRQTGVDYNKANKALKTGIAKLRKVCEQNGTTRHKN